MLLMCTVHVMRQSDLRRRSLVQRHVIATLESPGIDPGASRMLSERSAI